MTTTSNGNNSDSNTVAPYSTFSLVNIVDPPQQHQEATIDTQPWIYPKKRKRRTVHSHSSSSIRSGGTQPTPRESDVRSNTSARTHESGTSAATLLTTEVSDIPHFVTVYFISQEPLVAPTTLDPAGSNWIEWHKQNQPTRLESTEQHDTPAYKAHTEQGQLLGDPGPISQVPVEMSEINSKIPAFPTGDRLIGSFSAATVAQIVNELERERQPQQSRQSPNQAVPTNNTNSGNDGSPRLLRQSLEPHGESNNDPSTRPQSQITAPIVGVSDPGRGTRSKYQITASIVGVSDPDGDTGLSRQTDTPHGNTGPGPSNRSKYQITASIGGVSDPDGGTTPQNPKAASPEQAAEPDRGAVALQQPGQQAGQRTRQIGGEGDSAATTSFLSFLEDSNDDWSYSWAGSSHIHSIVRRTDNEDDMDSISSALSEDSSLHALTVPPITSAMEIDEHAATGQATAENSAQDSQPRPADGVWPPMGHDLMQSIRRALAWKPRPRTKPAFDFRMTTEAAESNFATLQANNFDLQGIIMGDPKSPLRPGSEFRPAGLLEPIFEHHPLWIRTKRSLLVGAKMPLQQISEIDRLAFLDLALSYGNHKSAKRHAATLLTMLDKEVQKGWQLPLPVHRLRDIPDIVVSPLSMVEQTTIDEAGNSIPKLRLAHDQSFAFQQEVIPSVNQRVDEEKMSATRYGFALMRFLHAIVALRALFPNMPILLTKIDFKSAYRRLHFHAESAFQSTVTLTDLEGDADVALVSLRQTFGASSGPTMFGEVSEPITDLACAICRCTDWKPDTVTPIHSTLIAAPITFAADIPFAAARDMLVDPGMDKHGTTEVYLDDILGAFPFTSLAWVKRCALAPLLALEIFSRPVVSDGETLPRDDMLAIDKAMAEATPSETNTTLGWVIDTRRLTIGLPEKKRIDWTRDITTVLEKPDCNRRIQCDELETLVGRLERVASILPEGKHFLNRLHAAELRARRHGATRLSVECRKDLALWIAFLLKAFQGVDINILVSRVPDRIIRTDACEHGLGGFSLTTGRAWRWEIPVEIRLTKSINFLEFLACVAGILVSLSEETDVAAGDCYLSLGDNTSSLGWLRRSNFAKADDDQASHSGLARYYAMIMAEQGVCSTSQWFAGKENEAADFLSREPHETDLFLTASTLTRFPEQVSPDFRVSPLPPQIISLLDYWVRHTHETTALPPRLTVARPIIGKTGSSFSSELNSLGIPSSSDSIATTKTASWGHSPTPSASKHIPKVQKEMLNWLRAPAKPLFTRYARPSSMRDDPTHPWTQTGRLRSFYTASFEATPTRTRRQNNKKPFPSN